MKRHEYGRNCGFTLIELLIVIAVIGILLGIVTVLYPGHQMRTRDAERKSDLTQLSAGFAAYVLQKNNYMTTGSGCGLNGNGNGWISAKSTDVSGYATKSIATCLQEAGVIKEADFKDPFNCTHDSGGICGSYRATPAQAYMKVTCLRGGNSVTYLLAHLEAEPRKDAEIDGLCDPGTVMGFTSETQKWGTDYGMNYYVQVK